MSKPSLDDYCPSKRQLERRKAWQKLHPQEKTYKRGAPIPEVQVEFSLPDLLPSYSLPSPVRYHHIDSPNIPSLQEALSPSTDDKTSPTCKQDEISPERYYPDIRKKGPPKKVVGCLEFRAALRDFQKRKGLDRKWEPPTIPDSGIPDELIPTISKEEKDYICHVKRLFPEHYS